MFNALGYNPELVFRKMPVPSGFLRTVFPIPRVLPDVFLPGAQKSGTTSLYSLLIEHPSVAEPQLKEPFFFGNDDRYSSDLRAYRRNFPPRIKLNYLKRTTGFAATVDATTNYLDNAETPRRIKAAVPAARIIILLRNPVERAFSQYKMAKRNGIESLPFEEALKLEDERIASGAGQLHNYCRQRLGYRTRGEYISVLRPWIDTFAKEQLLILRAEDFFSAPEKIYSEVLQFLQLPAFIPHDFTAVNTGQSSRMLPETRALLAAHYVPFNTQLEELLGRKMNWS